MKLKTLKKKKKKLSETLDIYLSNWEWDEAGEIAKELKKIKKKIKRKKKRC